MQNMNIFRDKILDNGKIWIACIISWVNDESVKIGRKDYILLNKVITINMK